MMAGRGWTTIKLTREELATLRLWLDEGITQYRERDGFDDDGQPRLDESDPDVGELYRLDRKLARAVQRTYH